MNYYPFDSRKKIYTSRTGAMACGESFTPRLLLHYEARVTAAYLRIEKDAEDLMEYKMDKVGEREDYGVYEVLGRTMDDAAGEAYDKVARAIGLGYPGGPKIDKAARDGDPEAIAFPRAHVDGEEYDFSFSGLKSAVLNYLNSCEMKGETINTADVAASFQAAVVDVLVGNSMKAADRHGVKRFAIAGGVASNSALREAMEKACSNRGIEFYRPSPILCTDNGAMIAGAAYFEYKKGKEAGLSLNAIPGLKLEDSE